MKRNIRQPKQTAEAAAVLEVIKRPATSSMPTAVLGGNQQPMAKTADFTKFKDLPRQDEELLEEQQQDEELSGFGESDAEWETQLLKKGTYSTGHLPVIKASVVAPRYALASPNQIVQAARQEAQAEASKIADLQALLATHQQQPVAAVSQEAEALQAEQQFHAFLEGVRLHCCTPAGSLTSLLAPFREWNDRWPASFRQANVLAAIVQPLVAAAGFLSPSPLPDVPSDWLFLFSACDHSENASALAVVSGGTATA